MPVLTLEKTTTPVALVAPAVRAAHSPLKVPAWAVLVVIALAAGIGFAAGRHKPAHHYVSYFGYPMVLDTTTGKACYATKPNAVPSSAVQDTAYSLDGSGQTLADPEIPNGAAVPLCGQE